MRRNMLFMIVFLMVSSIGLYALSDAYILEELDQAKSDTEVKIENDTQNVVPPAVGMIKDIETIGGTQKYLYVALGSKTRGLKVGLKGYVYNDNQLKEKVGKVEVVEIYSDLSKMKIIETSYTIDKKGVVSIEVDPRSYIE